MRAAFRLLCAVALFSACSSGLPSPRPILGYNTWNAFRTKIDEALIKTTADRLVDTGLAAAGYTYLNIDDGWSAKQRDSSGRLVGHSRRFPSGMAALGRYIHSRGLQFGIYSSAGRTTCAHYPGSRGYEQLDAQTWAEWGVDYLKYDNCGYDAADWDPVPRFLAMAQALNHTGRAMVYSLCEWGWLQPWVWADKVGHSWRTTGDIKPTWESIMKILDANTDLARFAGPDKGWGDADMLEVGNGQLSLGEQRAHFALWALLKSPLLIGADLRSLAPASLAILKAQEVIAVNQDELGVAGDLVWVAGDLRVYAAPLAGGSRAVVLLNAGSTTSNITVRWEQLGLPADTAAAVRDLYARQELGQHKTSFTAVVPPHDVAALRITAAEAGSNGRAGDGWKPWHQLHGSLPSAAPRSSLASWAAAALAAATVVVAGTACALVVWRKWRFKGWQLLGDMPASSVQLGLMHTARGMNAEHV